ncbi:MAG: maleylpyruvate isomerase N-terminal domain-containing protein [Acidimicrobiales bacterium]|jgi:uncharacterized protein (TIGR03083 family)|nr:hypothetical protein [Actinomycetota bacterium]HAQ04764.1 hypothetical protein [Acidimicrobiaceae bacterium]|tara:strand:- start:5757 stop:6458 length:702 start_codon:yes stop_codon:yes gene_type:complete
MNQNNPVEFKELLVAVEQAGRSLIDSAEKDLDAIVPTCPEWNNLELLNHMKMVWWFAASQIAAGNEHERTVPSDEMKNSPLEQLEHLLDTFQINDFSSPCWSWTTNRTVGFWVRRMAHENTVHNWDTEGTLGAHSSVPPLLAVDGIEEKLFMHPADADFPDASIHLHCTDCEGEWMLASSGGELEIKREHGKGDAAVRGKAEDILLYLWGRGQENLECFGDEEVINAWALIGP